MVAARGYVAVLEEEDAVEVCDLSELRAVLLATEVLQRLIMLRIDDSGMRTRTRISYVLLWDEVFLDPKSHFPESSIGADHLALTHFGGQEQEAYIRLL